MEDSQHNSFEFRFLGVCVWGEHLAYHFIKTNKQIAPRRED